MKQWINYLKKIMCNGGIFILVSFLTYKLIFSNTDFKKLTSLVLNLDMRYIYCGVLTIVFMLCAEGYTIKRNLRLLGEDKGFFQCLAYAFVGNFFSGITPAATGGQPMQLYFMKQNHIAISKGTLALLMDLGAYQIAILSLSVVGYIRYFTLINQSLGNLIPILWVGIALNIILLVITFVAMFSQKFIYHVVSFVGKIVARINKSKGKVFKEKALAGVKNFKASADILRKHKSAYMVNTLLTFLRIIAMHSAPFWIYKSLGLSQAGYFKILSLQSCLYISGAALPLPGGVGVGESGFLFYFKNIFPAEILESAMVLSRGIGFYFVIIFCGLILSVLYIRSKINKKLQNKDVRIYAPQSNRN